MPNRNKCNGDQAEQALVLWLRANGFPDACRARGEATDRGDLGGIPGVCVQVKRAAQERYIMPRLRAAQQGASEQAMGRLPVAVVRLPRVTDPSKWWASVPAYDEWTRAWFPDRRVVNERCPLPVLGAALEECRWVLRGDWLVTSVSELFGALR